MRGRMRQGGISHPQPKTHPTAGHLQTCWSSNHKTPVSHGKLNHSRVWRERKHKLVSREHYRASLIISAVFLNKKQKKKKKFRSKPEQNYCAFLTHSSDSLLNESTFLNESSESMIQWLIHENSHLLHFQNDSAVRTNRVSQWFSASSMKTATCFIFKMIQRFEQIEWVNDSVTHPWKQPLASFSKWFSRSNESSESMIQWLIHENGHLLHFQNDSAVRTNRVSQWFSDSSMKTATCFIFKMIQPFERIEWVNDSVTHPWKQPLASFSKWFSHSNELSESMIQWLIHKDSLNSFLNKSTVWMNWLRE